MSDIFVVRDFIDVFPEDLSMTTTTTSGVPHRFGSWSDASCEVSISSNTLGNARIHGVHLKLVLELLRKEKLYAKVTIDALSRKEQVKPRRVRAMAMTIQYGVRGMILAAQSEAFKQENGMMRMVVMNKAHTSRSPVIWAEIEGSSLIGPELVQETTDKRDLFWKKGKLAPRYVRPFEILERISPVAYRLRLPKELSGDEIKVDKTLHFVEEPVEIMDREVKRVEINYGIEDVNTGSTKVDTDEFNKEREAFVKDKVKDASSKLEIGVDAIPTATKPPTIVNWKIISQLNFSRDELVELYRLVIKKYGANRPEEMYNKVLWGDLKTMFDPPLSDDAIWSLPLQQKIINWRYYPTCVVHCLTLDASTIYMLADRKYPLSKDACQVMLEMKLLDGTMDEVCYKLLKMIEKQAGIRK
ncbi:hypothetical protein Tco_1314029 [Tanacetum coccineum]